jgi:CheY-like chemotaxis protein
MSKANTRQEAKPQTIEANSPVLIDSAALGKKDCLHILHVDDDVYVLEVTRQVLSMENNFEVEGALSVDEAFKKLEKQTYNAIVSDYEMPLKNGLDFLKELRDQQRDIPFILFTGKGREEVVVKAQEIKTAVCCVRVKVPRAGGEFTSGNTSHERSSAQPCFC